MATATKARPEQQAAQLVLTLPPDYFARAWANLRTANRLSDLGLWWLESYDGEGCWLVTTGGPVTQAAWVPCDPDAPMPDLKSEPDDVVCFSDVDNRLDDLCRRLVKHYGAKDQPAPDFSDYLQVRPGTDVRGQAALTGLAAPGHYPPVSVWSNGERHDVLGSDIPAVQWRHIVRTFEHGPRDNVHLRAELAKVLISMKGLRASPLNFSTGSNAICHHVPEANGWPHIIGVYSIGARQEAPKDDEPEPAEPAEPTEPSAEAGALPDLRQQVWDPDTGEYFDAPRDDWSE